MYSRSMTKRSEYSPLPEPDPVNHIKYSVPPGYDGSRFVKDDHVVTALPDSAFTPDFKHHREAEPSFAARPSDPERADGPSSTDLLSSVLSGADADQLLIAGLMILLYVESNHGQVRDDRLMFCLALLLISR